MKAITHLNLRERLPVTLTMEESGPTRTWKKTLPSTSVRGERDLSEQSSSRTPISWMTSNQLL